MKKLITLPFQFSVGLIRLCFYFFSKKVLTLLARAVIKMLNDARIHYWADFGTLLGLVRDNGIIYKDTDVDFTVIEDKETIDKLDKCCENTYLWFRLKKDTNRRSYCAYFKFLPARADIYVNRLSIEENVLIGCEGPYSNIPHDLVQQLVKIDWNGMPVTIPAKAAEILSYRYGNDWRVRKEDCKGILESTYKPTTCEESLLRTTDVHW